MVIKKPLANEFKKNIFSINIFRSSSRALVTYGNFDFGCGNKFIKILGISLSISMNKDYIVLHNVKLHIYYNKRRSYDNFFMTLDQAKNPETINWDINRFIFCPMSIKKWINEYKDLISYIIDFTQDNVKTCTKLFYGL